MATDMTIANTILAQLGGAKFRAMTGAHSFTGDAHALTFKFPNGRAKVFACKIRLNAMDTYDVEFFKKDGKYNVVMSDYLEGVYADMLGDMFTRITGLDVSL